MSRPAEASPSRPVILGVAGGSGSGKSTVVREVLRILGEDVAAVIRHDWYYRDLATVPFEDRVGVNFDHPDSLETELLVHHLRELVSGKSVHVPAYDFASHTRSAETTEVRPHPLLVLDGILVLAHPDLRRLMDLRVYVDTEADVRLLRRVRRDVERRGRSADSVLRQYEDTVRPMHLEFVEPSRAHADMIIAEGGYNRVAIDLLVNRLRHLLAEAGAGQLTGQAGPS